MKVEQYNHVYTEQYTVIKFWIKHSLVYVKTFTDI